MAKSVLLSHLFLTCQVRTLEYIKSTYHHSLKQIDLSVVCRSFLLY